MGFVPSPGTTAYAIVNIISEKREKEVLVFRRVGRLPVLEPRADWDMEVSGLIPPGSAALAREALSFYWIFPERKVPRALQQESSRAEAVLVRCLEANMMALWSKEPLNEANAR